LVWIDNSWIDYLVPQVYWEFGHPTADYNGLANYWNDNSRGVKMFIGIAAYKFKDPVYPAFGSVNEFGRQIDKVREKPNLYGEVFYRVRYLDNTELKNYLREKFLYKSLSPLSRTIGVPNLDNPSVILNGKTLSWSGTTNPNKIAVYVLVQDPVVKNLFKAKLTEIVSGNDYTVLSAKSYFVTSVNSDNVESARSNIISVQ
jgi:hypothetical protein